MGRFRATCAVAATLFSAVLVLASTGCGSSDGSSTSTASTGTHTAQATGLRSELPAEYQDGIKVGVLTGAEPYSFEKAGKLMGLDPTMVEAIGKQLGVPIKVTGDSDFVNELLGVQQGRSAFMMDVNPTPERMKTYDFVSYFKDGYGFGALVDGGPAVATLEDLCGMRIAVTAGDQANESIKQFSEDCTSKGKPAVTVVTVPSYAAATLAVEGKRADLAAMGLGYLGVLARSNGGNKWHIVGPSFNEVTGGIAFPKGSKLAPVVQKAVNQLIANGEYKKIVTENLSERNSISHAELNPQPEASPSK